jgi:hypothetical protein
MKTIEITASQESTIFTFSVNYSKSVDLNKVKGTALNELFAWITVQKQVGAKGLKLSLPINLKVVCDGFEIDTNKARKELQNRLKLNSTAKSKRNFARKFSAIVDFSARKPETIDFDLLLSDLETIINTEV